MWTPVEAVSDAEGGGAPCARGKHACALLAGSLYVLGGRGAGGAVPLRDCWRYHLATGRWERLRTRGEAPPALQEHSMTAHETRLYVFGGEASLSAETPLWILDIETLIWRKLPGSCTGAPTRRRGRSARPPAPSGRRGHSAHALNDCLLVYGGYKDLRGSTNELWAFHYESETWQAVRTVVAGPARHRHAAALHDARLYVHGGQCDLRACADLWHYDTLSRMWTLVRTPPRLSPAARCGHAGLRAGSHLYVFGGELDGAPTNELWRFHFATETWERLHQNLKWPGPRVDPCAVVLAGSGGGARGGAGGRGAARGGGGIMSRLTGFNLRRAARCSYSVLAPNEQDSTESLVRDSSIAKSRSAYVIEGGSSPRPGDLPDTLDLPRDPASVPDFTDMVLPTPVLSPTQATRLVYFDSEEEEEMRRESETKRPEPDGAVTAITKSASVRFRRTHVTDEEGDTSTSDYASAERVNRLSGASLGFSNPHYLGPDVRALGAALTPDSGAGTDIELVDLRRPTPAVNPRGLCILVVGGREPPHPAHMASPLSMWTYALT